MTRSSLITIVFIGLIVFVVAAYTWSIQHVSRSERLAASPANSALAVPEGEAPYTTLDGDVVDVTSRLGDILVVTSWASWCPSCATELPKLSALAAEYDDVSFVAINRAEQRTTAERFLRTVNATSGIELVLDPDDRYYGSIGGYAMPETIVYDQNGDAILHLRGDADYDRLRDTLDQLLQGEGT